MTSKFSNQPLYLQVHDALAERLAAGEWKPNATMPNEMDLARELGVSPGTTRKALDLLENEGLVARRQGRGTFVNDPASLKAAGRYSNFHSADGERIIGEITVRDVFEGTASAAERDRLQLATEDLIYRLQRARSHMGKTFLVETVVLPVGLFPGLPERKLVASGITLIANAYGILLGKAVEAISPGAASSSTAMALQIDEASPVLVLDRIIKTRDGRHAEWCMAECTTKVTRYEVQTI